MVDYFRAKGGEFRYNSRLQKIVLGADGRVDGFQLSDGSTVKADLYISAMPGERSFLSMPPCGTILPVPPLTFWIVLLTTRMLAFC